MAIFLTGCTHFGHENIIRLAKRPFKDIEEMDKELIRRWNSVVRPTDLVYHLGDFSYKSALPPEHYIGRLNGFITGVQGNHDADGFGQHIIDFKINKRRVVLCHYPIEEWNGWYNGAVHFHAHTHSTEFKSAERRGNVGVDANDFYPVPLNAAIERLCS